MVLVHGTPDTSGAFAKVLAHLAGLRVITYDRRGYGRSVHLAPMFPLAAIVAAVGLTRAVDAVAATRPMRIAAVALGLGLCALGLRGSLFTDLPRPEDMYGAAVQLNRGVRAGDVVAFGEPLEKTAIGWYWLAPVVEPAVDPLEVCRTWFVSRDVNLLRAMTAAAPQDATITSTGYDGWGVVLIDDCR